MIASAVLVAAGDDATKAKLLPGLADGSVAGAVALAGNVTVKGGKASGDAGNVLGGGLAQVLLVASGDDVAVVEVGDGVTVTVPANLDPSRRTAKVTLDGAAATVLTGARRTLTDLARVILAAEAVGVAGEAAEMGAAYARERLQFGRVIGTYQAVKHHCANMVVATEMATSAVWDAARAASTGGDQLSYAAAVAATLAAPAADKCANLNTQVHGGIAITWEHDAHLYMRRATTLLGLPGRRRGRRRPDRPRPQRRGAREGHRAAAGGRGHPHRGPGLRRQHQGPVVRRPAHQAHRDRLPHAATGPSRTAGPPAPWSSSSSSRSSRPAGIKKPQYGITAWNILTIIQYGNQDQLDRWVKPALDQEVVWCQLFSEPDAGSDAAGIKTKATRVDGGWLVNGQKVWTSGAHYSGMGFATVRTNPDVPKHDGITMMAIDMHGSGVEVRPLKMTTGQLGVQRGLLQRRVRARTTTSSAPSTAAGPWPAPPSATRA